MCRLMPYDCFVYVFFSSTTLKHALNHLNYLNSICVCVYVYVFMRVLGWLVSVIFHYFFCLGGNLTILVRNTISSQTISDSHQ